MKRQIPLALLAALFLAGCGGRSVKLSPPVTKAQVLTSLGLFDNLARQGSVGPNAPALKPARLIKTSRSGMRTVRAPRAVAETIFDETYQLWYVEFMDGDPSGDHTWGRHYYADQALTQPAGDDSIHSVWNTDPQTDDETFNFSAGPAAGLHIEDHESLDGAGNGRQWGAGHIPGQPNYSYTMEWKDGGYASVDEKFTDADGSWTRYQSLPKTDGFNYIVTTWQGTRMDLHFGFNYDGSGTITGAGSALPATLEWDTLGTGMIHWHDGTETAFDNWSIFS